MAQQQETPTHLWLRTLYGNSPGFFTVIVFVDGKPRTTWYETNDIDRVAVAIGKAAEKFDVYCSVATYKARPEKGRGSLKDVQSIPGWWADLDIGTEGHKPAQRPNPANVDEAMSILDDMPKPTAVIHSGGGLQVWWLFEEPWVFEDPADAQRASNEWQNRLVQQGEARGFHVDSLGDLPRILRVPGTQNHKTDNIRPVTLVETTPLRYPAAELAAVGVPEVLEPRPPGLDGWAAILEPHGWTHVGVRSEDGADLWCRPGKKASEGHSAVTNPYGIPVMVNFSGSAGLPVGPGQRLTMFRVWAHLNYDGDMERAKAALEELATIDDKALLERAARFEKLDWDEVFKGEQPEVEWLAEPLVEKGRQIAVYSEAKAGKSMLFLEIGARLAAGQTQFCDDHEPTGTNYSVVYIDLENTKFDIGERLRKMGFEADQLDTFHYYSFPSVGYLDRKEGALNVLALVFANHADLLVIDTLSRVVEGDENDNDTYIRFYKHTGVALKARGIGLVRLDHSGKDQGKGMRGASSKTNDVDEVWQLTVGQPDHNGEQWVKLHRTHSRSAHGVGDLMLKRKENPLRHVITDELVEMQEDSDMDLTVNQTHLDILNKILNVPIPKGLSKPKLLEVWTQKYGQPEPAEIRLIWDIQCRRTNRDIRHPKRINEATGEFYEIDPSPAGNDTYSRSE